MLIDTTAAFTDTNPAQQSYQQTRMKILNEQVIKKGAFWQVQVSEHNIERIKQDCQNKNLPLIEEFDFSKDRQTPDLKIELKSTTQVREY